MKNLIQRIAMALVDHPDEVVVTEIGNGNVVIYEVQVAKSDTGKLIGRQGRTVDAFRILVNAASAKTRRRAILQILEYRGGLDPRISD